LDVVVYPTHVQNNDIEVSSLLLIPNDPRVYGDPDPTYNCPANTDTVAAPQKR